MAEPVELRFKNLAADGRVSTSEVIKLEHAPPPPARLFAPVFGHAAYSPGDEASISVATDGVRRGSITLLIEQQVGGAWQQVASLPAPVEAGQAFVRWQVPDGEGTAAFQLRVRAVAEFGEETSEPCTVQPLPKLTDPAFSHAHPSRGSHFDDGDEAVMRVAAQGLDGRTVRFVVEQRQGEAWAAYQTVTAVAQNGEAVAKVVVHHPVLATHPTLPQLQGARPLQLRFHAELQ